MQIEQKEIDPKHEQEKRFLCRHIFTDGRRCGSPALRREPFCYYHHTSRSRAAAHRHKVQGQSQFALPNPEDRSAIQHCIGDVIQRIAANQIDARRAGLLLYGLQTASLNLPKQPKEPSAAAIEIVEEVTIDPEMGPLAPEKETGESKKKSAALLELQMKLNQEREAVWAAQSEAMRLKNENLKLRNICVDAGVGLQEILEMTLGIPEISAARDSEFANEGPTTLPQEAGTDDQAKTDSAATLASPPERHSRHPKEIQSSLQYLNRAARRAKQRRHGNPVRGSGFGGGWRPASGR